TVTWKVPHAKAADQFFRAVRTPENAKKFLLPLVNGRLAAVISTVPIDDLIGVVDTQTGLAGLTGVAVALPGEGVFRSADAKLIDDRTERVRLRVFGDEGL